MYYNEKKILSVVKVENSGGITPTGTINITANGTYDVTNYASAAVATPPPTGTININSNGTTDVTNYASAVVNVPTRDNDINNILDGTPTTVYTTTYQLCHYALYRLSHIQGITAPNITQLGQYSLAYTGITQLILPALTTINMYACLGCQSLVSINLPSILTVRDEAFRSCDNLETATFGNNYITIGPSIFKECAKLHTVDMKMQNTATTMFENCYSLKKIIIRGYSVIPLVVAASNAFKNCYHIFGTTNATYNPNGLQDGYIYVDDSLVSTYQTATNWSAISTQFKPLSELEE